MNGEVVGHNPTNAPKVYWKDLVCKELELEGRICKTKFCCRK